MLPEVIEDICRCRQVVETLSLEQVLAIDCEGIQLGVDGPLTLVQVGTYSGEVYLFDIHANRELLKKGRLGYIMESKDIVKVMQSCSNDSAALHFQFNVTLRNVFDTQAAHLLIEEHKGRQLAPPLKLDDICKKYSGKKGVSEYKEDIRAEWIKRTADFWAQRPMTEEMIMYAAGDVTSIIPEVYENQREYLESNGLMSKFQERVCEEINYLIDPIIKAGREKRIESTVKRIVANISSTCSENTKISNFEDEGDEYRAIQKMDFTEAEMLSPLMSRLKTEQIMKELQEMNEKLEAEGEAFYVRWRSGARLRNYQRHPNEGIRKKSKQILEKIYDIVLKDIYKKYDMDTPLIHVSGFEKEALRSLRPSGDNDPRVNKVALRLYWMVMEEDLRKKMEDFKTKQINFTIPEGYYKKMKFFAARRSKVPETLKTMAARFLDDLDQIFGFGIVPS
ncbi:uncharacterized protein LOC133179465 [Saccostrea echinata]|uniref:uncharacterized protein LOC133179465 n=1 Tax=Saccostrea echinata TaxID=191078 RepID=UPI002A82525E|nr:uncharacterized protein LOC133179465 [Saccostrea echinata]